MVNFRETKGERGIKRASLIHFQPLTGIRKEISGLIPAAAVLMRVRTFPMYGFCEGFLAIFGRALAPRNGRLDISPTFIVTLHPLFEQPQNGEEEDCNEDCFFQTKQRKSSTYGWDAPSV